MKRLGFRLLEQEPFSELVTGNTALVRGMIEAGVEVAASYPGSPTPEIAAAIQTMPPEKRPFYFEYSTNEKVATEVALGASLNGRLGVVFFKSVGLNVAADTFVQLPLFNIIGGMVIILGDDPGANSSQNEQDNRHYAKMAKMAVWEPAHPQEAYEMFLEAASFAGENQTAVILRLTTHVCHAKGRVQFGPRPSTRPQNKALFDPANGPYIPLGRALMEMKRLSLEKLDRAAAHAEGCLFNQIVDKGNRERGIIVCGLPALSLEDVLEDCPLSPDILKLGMPWPLAKNLIAEFCRNHREVKVLEELDPIIETEVKALAYEKKLTTLILGREDREEWIGEYTPDKVRTIIRTTWPDLGLPEAAPWGEPIPPRPPQLCPGCGHRSAFHAVKGALQGEDITVADVGCHTLGFMEPHKTGQVLACMGHSNGTGAGLALGGHQRRVVTFLGDSTFFHAGLPGIINALTNRHNLTLVVMNNGTTAMTGHQDHPGSEGRISIRAVLEGLGVDFIREVDTYRQGELTRILKEALDHPSFSVVIASHPCMLKFTRDQRRRGRPSKARAVVDSEKCDRLRHCLGQFACPALHLTEDGSAGVHPDLCIGDGSCVQVCPVEALSLKKRAAQGEKNGKRKD